jgi:hypothetical protein
MDRQLNPIAAFAAIIFLNICFAVSGCNTTPLKSYAVTQDIFIAAVDTAVEAHRLGVVTDAELENFAELAHEADAYFDMLLPLAEQGLSLPPEDDARFRAIISNIKLFIIEIEQRKEGS